MRKRTWSVAAPGPGGVYGGGGGTRTTPLARSERSSEGRTARDLGLGGTGGGDALPLDIWKYLVLHPSRPREVARKKLGVIALQSQAAGRRRLVAAMWRAELGGAEAKLGCVVNRFSVRYDCVSLRVGSPPKKSRSCVVSDGEPQNRM
jgi:hypothetical protein